MDFPDFSRNVDQLEILWNKFKRGLKIASNKCGDQTEWRLATKLKLIEVPIWKVANKLRWDGWALMSWVCHTVNTYTQTVTRMYAAHTHSNTFLFCRVWRHKWWIFVYYQGYQPWVGVNREISLQAGVISADRSSKEEL